MEKDGIKEVCLPDPIPYTTDIRLIQQKRLDGYSFLPQQLRQPFLSHDICVLNGIRSVLCKRRNVPDFLCFAVDQSYSGKASIVYEGGFAFRFFGCLKEESCIFRRPLMGLLIRSSGFPVGRFFALYLKPASHAEMHQGMWGR